MDIFPPTEKQKRQREVDGSLLYLMAWIIGLSFILSLWDGCSDFPGKKADYQYRP